MVVVGMAIEKILEAIKDIEVSEKQLKKINESLYCFEKYYREAQTWVT